MPASNFVPLQITLEDIGHRFGKNTVIRDLNACITAQEHVVIRGRNGSGKSTLGRIIAGHLTPSFGTIRWEQVEKGATVIPLEAEETSLKTMLIGPGTSLHPELSPRELIQFHSQFRSWWADCDPLERLSEAGLIAHLDAPFRTLSSGLKQRVALTLALSTQCGALILDEPCGNLDTDGIKWYRSSLELIRGRTTVCICSNDRKEDHLEPDQTFSLIS